ncbi:small integral membrane protein 3 isoform X1 [Aptenodytes patagonicus]|uniref:small integral membrane protein 3 isoform X1 n=1 Tax=Aptenodytes patagonicus TaxID=9234 RepID=UPI003F9FB16C
MDLPDPAGPADLPKHILDIWVIVLIILATILVMTALVLCPATAVIIYRISAEIGKPYGTASSSEFRGAEERRQLLPACLPAHRLRLVLLPMARALTAHLARRPRCGGLCAPRLGRQSGKSRAVRAQAVARDHVSSYIAPCYEIN